MFCALNAAAGLGVLALADTRHGFEQWETDSILLSTPKDTNLDLLILGTSHARLLTRVKHNYEFLSDELDMRIFNMAIGFGGGILLEKMYLENFFDEGNQADTVLYFLDPYVLFSPMPNMYHRFVYYEPFRFTFLYRMVQNGMPFERLFTYVRSKFTVEWFTLEPGVYLYNERTLVSEDIPLDPERMRARADSLYPDGVNMDYFARFGAIVPEVLDLLEEHGCRVIIIFPPTLMGPEKGAGPTKELLEGLEKTHDFEFHDLTGAIDDPGLYYDYDHLNSPGVEFFVREYLEPILAEKPEQSS